MSRFPQPSDSYGSLRDIQILVNQDPVLLNKKIKEKLTNIRSDKIDWVSPLEDDDFSEYRDEAFLERLGIKPAKIPLNSFWPARGSQWDALGKGKNKEVFLVEAKANIPEMVSPPTGASEKSLAKIRKALLDTKNYLKIRNDIDWAKQFYQYTNRLAHLYFLRILNKIPAYLVFLYFLDDTSVDGPKTIAEWEAAITVMKKYLGISRHRLERFVADVFIDVKELTVTD
ncbi:MAG: hypothetical protein FJZ11_00585 [Candidatus Omnitrophica bacterium]|nr:hypothetical protein [Candidatus Omnitrophota bacterium]